MLAFRLSCVAVLASGGLGYCQQTATDVGAPRKSNDFHDSVRPLVQQYCFGCHGAKDPKGDLDLSVFSNDADVLKSSETWRRAWDALRRGEMPPRAPRPTADERQRLLAAIGGLLERAARDGGREPGHTVLRRLNQVEYNNTVLDLFGAFRPTSTSGGTQFDPQKGMPQDVRAVLHREPRTIAVPLPPENLAYGFTNIGEVLAVPPFLLEKYVAASRQVIDKLVDQQGPRDPRLKKQVTDPREAARAWLSSYAQRTLGKPFTSTQMQRDPGGSARQLLTAFGRRAFRRPLTDDEVARYLKLFTAGSERGQPFEVAIKLPMQAMLVSPHFLFRTEHGVATEERDGLRPLSSHELATRLSYFLWSTMPDEPLVRIADADGLRDPDALEAQAKRMLRHRFAKELGEQFGMQWLELTGIRAAMPFPDLYPQYYRMKNLPEAMQLEAQLLFETIMVEDRSVLDFIDPGFTWMNRTLVEFYGSEVPGTPDSLNFRRYPLTDERRGGVLTMASTMLATSLAARTSPVKRGKWVLDNLLGASPPPPPANVEELDKTAAVADKLSLRERLERHRADASCAACHRRMDPLGFGLENFDAIGAWRDKDGTLPIDTTGTLPDGVSFKGPAELRKMLVTVRRDDFLRCLTEKMLTFALGRKLEYSDAPAVDQIVDQLKRNDYRFSTLVVGIVRSEPFRFARTAALANERNQP